MGVATVAWLATDHQQLMYLLSPEGKTVFYIPGVEVVHKVSTPINLPDESNKIKRRLSSTCANLSHPAQTIWRLRTPLPPLVQLPWDQLAETWRCIELCPSHIEALTCTRAYQRHNRTKGFPSLCKPLPILDLLQGLRGRTTPRPTKCRMESRLRTSLMIIQVCLEVITGQRG